MINNLTLTYTPFKKFAKICGSLHPYFVLSCACYICPFLTQKK